MQSLRNEPVRLALKELDESLHYSETDLRVIRNKRLYVLIKHAIENIPFYQNKYRNHIEYFSEIDNESEIEEFIQLMPPITKQEAISYPDQIVFKGRLKYGTTKNITSGSTGDPLLFPCDNLSWAYRHASFFRCLSLYNIKIGEPYGYFFGQHWRKSLRFTTSLKDFLFNRVRVSAFDINERTFYKNLRKLRNSKVTHFIGYPSAIFDFCVIAMENKADMEDLNLKAVITTAEPLLDYQRSLIEKVTNSKCINYYGSVEGGAGIFEAPDGRMYENTETTHLLVDKNGELYCTDLFLFAYPLIKYQIGDFIEVETESRNKLFDRKCYRNILGRNGVPFKLPNGKLINANLPSYIFKGLINQKLVKKYRFYQNETNKEICLRMVPSVNFNNRSIRIIESEVYKAFGNDILLRVEIVDSLPLLPNAKHRDYIVES